MRSSLLLTVAGFLVFFAVIATLARGPHRGSLSGVGAHIIGLNPGSPDTNSPPTANNDTYNTHGGGTIGPLLGNDSDPDGDVMHIEIVTFPIQGRLLGMDGNSFTYRLNSLTFTGTDSFTYKACDTSNACSGAATVTINVSNQAPVALDDSYTVHGGATIGPMMANDSDADGDSITWNLVTAPSHGTLHGLPNPSPGDLKTYTAFSGYLGPDMFTYKVCDDFGLCSSPATVTLNVNNNPPVPGPDFYVVRGNTIIGPMYLNDYDPDGDDFISFGLVLAPGTNGAEHGTVFGLDISQPGDLKLYKPDAGYVGLDSFQYQITDELRATGTTTVTLYVLENDDAENAGRCSPCPGNGGAMAVGGPVNVTNGNMYLQQTDYQLPGVGPALNITRTYNSILKTEGLFGRGWSTIYDTSIQTYDPTFIRLNLPDGRAVYYTRPNNSSAFAAIEKDFHSDVIQNSDGSFTLSFKDGGSQHFSAAGKLLSLVDRHNNQTTLSYDGGGKLVSAIDPFGRVLAFNSNLSGQVLSISDSMGTIATYSYGSQSQLLSTTYADNSAYHFSYDDSLQLTSVTDALGNILESHTYDSQGRALTSEKQGGVEHYALNYVSDTQTDVTDALGHVTTYTIDKSKGRNVVTKVEGHSSFGNAPVKTWSYDDHLNVTSTTDALNYTTTFTYDAEGNRLTATDSTGTVTFTYNQLGEVLTRTDQMNGVTTNTYDSSGSLLVSRDALNNATTFTYDQRGELLTMTNALGKVTALAYDPSGNISQATDALGGVTRFVYDARGRLTRSTNALNFVTSYNYDAAGRINRITRPDLSFTTFTYDLGGRGIRVTDALNHNTSFAYDSAYRLTGVTDALGNSVSYSYDLMSNLTAATDQLGRTTNMEYDELNRPIKTIFPSAVTGATRLQETIEYDAAGNVIRSTDQTGRISSFEYDAAYRLVRVTDPGLQITRYEYNPRSNLIAVVDQVNQRYTFNYDALSRVTSVNRAGLQMSFAYDGAGNRTQRTDYNNITTNFAYDALNRLIAINYPDSTSANYSYDKLSRLTSASNVNGTVSFTYDNMGRVAGTTDVWGQVLNYTYDANGRRTRLSLGATTNATYVYDSLSRPIKITDGSKDAVSYAYDVTGKLTSRSLPNNVGTLYSYDGLDRLTQLSDRKGNKVIADNQYSYNNAGNVTQNIDQSGIHGYGYDVLDRLTSATYTGAPNEAYAYDGVGNRTSSHRSATYGYQPFNRLTNSSAASYLYDNNGNMISKSDGTGTTQFVWDFEDRLTQTVMPTAGSVTYKYDALGRRIQRAPSNGVSTNFVYDGQEVVKDINSDGSVVEYLNGPGVDNKIRQEGSSHSSTYYFSQDRLGSTTALTGSNGKLLERISYDAYGNSTGSTRTRYGYTGRERDPDTSLIYYRARWYDPQLGRFISEDPIGLAGGINQYAYVSNNPQNAKDPLGLYEIDVHYYQTYFIAMKIGCFTAAEARLIADADQGTDENESTAPGPGWTERQRQQNRDYHDLQPGNQEGQGSPMLWQQAMSGRMNYVGLGQYLHHLQDSFSHAGYESDTYGHAAALHYYDKTASDVPKALRMAGATWKALNDYAEKKCGCRGTWDAGWWQQIVDFSKEHGANFDALESIDSNGEIDNFGMTNNRAYLLRKIAILGLTPR